MAAETHPSLFLTGASSDIGLEIIRRVARPGMRIIAHYHSSVDALNKLRSEIPGELVPVRADLSAEREVAALWEEVQRLGGCPGAFVHLPAPKLTQVRFKDLTWKEMDQHLSVQFKSAFLLLSKMLPEMARRKQGKVVLMLSSVTLGVPPTALAHYVSAKYALLGLMQSLSAEYATKGIQINAVSPSMVDTKYLSNLPDLAKQMAAQHHPSKRLAVPADIAPAVEFLLSPASDFMSGTNLPVTGGEVF